MASTAVLHTSVADAAVIEETAKLVADDAIPFANFGDEVAVSGDTIVVGAPLEGTDEDPAQGAAYVFVVPSPGAAPELRATLTASDPQAFAAFGSGVAVDGDTIVVGAYGADNNTGRAYVFTEPAGGWVTATEDAVLTASDRGGVDWFGASVAIEGETIVVGATIAGAAYVFIKPHGGWSDGTEQAILGPPAEVGPGVGGVDVDGDTAVVGLPLATVDDDAERGAAAVFVEPDGGWATGTEAAAVLTASDGAAGDGFGDVAVDEDTIVVGAMFADVAGQEDQGAAYVFVEPPGGWTTGTETATLTTEGGNALDNFGTVDVDGDAIVVGARGAAALSGAAYWYVAPVTGWVTTTESSVLVGSDDTRYADFGVDVAIDADSAVIGAPLDDIDGQIGAGSAYVFTLPPIQRPPSIAVAVGGRCGRDQRSAMLNLFVDDADGSPSALELSATSSNLALLPPTNIEFGGTGTHRSMHVRTAAGTTGMAFVIVMVTDGTGTASTIVTVRATGRGDDGVVGSPASDIILGQGGDDTVRARAGKDIVCGGDGDDRLEGGIGGDTVAGAGGTNLLIGGDGDDRLDGGGSDDVVVGGPGRDRLAGGGGSDTLRGGLGPDVVFGGRGADRLFGDEGADRLTGDSGPDRFSGGAGIDVATDFAPATGDSQD
ncbi:MAG: hypothetical protein H0U21_10090, partial [Acidimicrobiia bacterium]|nr:hypothetical protein [Acidimicrobiia bacterium]